MIRVYHMNKSVLLSEAGVRLMINPNPTEVRWLMDRNLYMHIANIEADGLTDAMLISQNTGQVGGWWADKRVTLCDTPGDINHRSTSVGDVFELDDGSKFLVSTVGFKPLPDSATNETTKGE